MLWDVWTKTHGLGHTSNLSLGYSRKLIHKLIIACSGDIVGAMWSVNCHLLFLVLWSWGARYAPKRVQEAYCCWTDSNLLHRSVCLPQEVLVCGWGNETIQSRWHWVLPSYLQWHFMAQTLASQLTITLALRWVCIWDNTLADTFSWPCNQHTLLPHPSHVQLPLEISWDLKTIFETTSIDASNGNPLKM